MGARIGSLLTHVAQRPFCRSKEVDRMQTIRIDRAVEVLSSCEVFGGVGEGTLRAVAEQARMRCFRRGAFIFSEGEPGDALYVIVEGSVRVFVSSGRGEELVLAILGPSDPLGEVALCDGQGRSASAEVLEPATTLSLPYSMLMNQLRNDPVAMDALLASAARMLRRLTSRTADLVFLDLEGRIAKMLVEVGERRGRCTDEGVELDLGMSQSDLGRFVGGSRQRVNQILRAFEARRFIKTSGRTVMLTAPAALRARASLW